MKHAIFSPSTSEKWLNCPASPWMEQSKPDDAGVDAWEGTCAHFLAAYCLDNYQGGDVPPTLIGRNIVLVKLNDEDGAMWQDDYNGIGEIIHTAEVTHWMRECVAKYTTAIHRATPEGSMRFVEQSFDLEPVTGEVGATCTPDCVILTDDTLEIHDLKYGRTPVYAPGNFQLILYAMAVYRQLVRDDVLRRIRVHIHQPQIDNNSVCVLSEGELQTTQELVYVKVALGMEILDSNGPSGDNFNPGYWCGTGYCKARHECRAVVQYVDDQFITPYELPLNYEDMHTITEGQAVRIWQNRKLIRGLVDGIEGYLEAEMQKGRSFPGVKLVRGRTTSRQWKDKDDAKKALSKMRIKSDVKFPPGLASPAALEKAYKSELISKMQWNAIQDLIRKGEAKTEIALLEDSRPSVTPEIDVFENLESGTQINDDIFL